MEHLTGDIDTTAKSMYLPKGKHRRGHYPAIHTGFLLGAGSKVGCISGPQYGFTPTFC